MDTSVTSALLQSIFFNFLPIKKILAVQVCLMTNKVIVLQLAQVFFIYYHLNVIIVINILSIVNLKR